MPPMEATASLVDDCIANGRDYNDGGPRYNSTYIMGVAPGTCTDSLAAIKHHVFERGSLCMDELLEALRVNFEGHEKTRLMLWNRTPKYGNDDAYADEILARRKQVEVWYHGIMQSFEGIKPPYLALDVTEVHWMLYVVHLGKRFGASARDQLVQDLDTEAIGAAAYSRPLHQQFHYACHGAPELPNTRRIGDRALALPFHGFLTEDEVRFIVGTLKDTATNVGAGVPIY